MKNYPLLSMVLLLFFSCAKDEIDPEKYVMPVHLQTTRHMETIQMNYYMPLFYLTNSYTPNAVNADRYDLYLSENDTTNFQWIIELDMSINTYSHNGNEKGKNYFFKIKCSAEGVNPSYSNVVWVIGGENGKTETYLDIPIDYLFQLGSLSPDGNQLAYTRSITNVWKLMTYNFTSGTETKMVDGGLQSEWSHDGNNIVFTSSFGITAPPQPSNLGIINVNSMEINQFSSGQNVIQYPMWSEDDKDLYYLKADQTNSNQWEINQYNIENSSTRILIEDNEYLIVNAPIALHKQNNQLAFTAQDEMFRNGIYTFDLDSESIQPIEQINWYEFNPAFSSDGKYIAFISSRSGRDEIWVKDLFNSQRYQLTGNDQNYMQGKLLWTADNKKIIFKGYSQESYGVFTVEFNP